jgi:NADH-quinone oxidoreductase subunit F
MTTASLCGLGMTAPNPVRSTLRHFADEYLSHVRDRRCTAGVCHALFRSPCENACPLHMNVPGFLQLLNEGRPDDAYEMILLDNPLPAVTGRVCQHPCQSRCTRADDDEPVAIRDVHRFIADRAIAEGREAQILERIRDRRLASSGRRAAVVGAGPAGLTAAYYLALLGHRVALHDATTEPGGLLRWALPEYRLPRAVLRAELQFLRLLGIDLVMSVTLGKELSLAQLERDFDAVLLALGTGQQASLGVAGSDLAGVTTALDFLAACAAGEPPALGEDVVVIGGGNAAIDAARTAARLGARVRVAYRRQRKDMPAIAEEVEQAVEEGVELLFDTGVPAIVGDAGRCRAIRFERLVPGRYDSSGRRRPEPTGEVREVPCSTVIAAIGESVDPRPLQEAGIELGPGGAPRLDPATGESSRPRVYLAGDLVSGPSNVARAMAGGRRAAEQIDAALSGSSRLASVTGGFSYGQTPPPRAVGGAMARPPLLGLADRRGSFAEVSAGISDVQARAEARRCLRCDVEQAEPGADDRATQIGA